MPSTSIELDEDLSIRIVIETELALPDITDRKEVVVSGTELSDIPAKKCGGAALQYDQKTALLWWMGGVSIAHSIQI